MSSESENQGQAARVEKWIVEAHEGNREALGRLLEMCRRYLLSMANRELTPTLSTKVAPSDIVQESLMEAGRHFSRFHGSTEKELLAWLRGILRNSVADVHRFFNAEKRQLAHEVPLADLPQAELPLNRTESPSGHAMARKQDEQLEKAIQKLPEHYRQVLLMHSTDGLTFVQIADKLGSTADAVRKLWGRALDELANLLESSHHSIRR